MVGPGGFEPPTPALSTRCSNQLSYEPLPLNDPIGGAGRDRTDDLLNANQALFQLSYGPKNDNATQSIHRSNRIEAKNNVCSSKTILCNLYKRVIQS